MQALNYLDLFSGIGVFHLGLKWSGFKFDKVFYSDIDKDKQINALQKQINNLQSQKVQLSQAMAQIEQKSAQNQ